MAVNIREKNAGCRLLIGATLLAALEAHMDREARTLAEHAHGGRARRASRLLREATTALRRPLNPPTESRIIG